MGRSASNHFAEPGLDHLKVAAAQDTAAAGTIWSALESSARKLAKASTLFGWISLACIILACAVRFRTGSRELAGPFGMVWAVSTILVTALGAITLRRDHPSTDSGRVQPPTGLILGPVNLVLYGLLLVLPFAPSLEGQRSQAQRQCLANLRLIGQFMTLYANDFTGHYPPRLELLMSEEDASPQLFACPTSGDATAAGPTTQAVLADFAKPGRCSYTYLGASLTPASPPECVVAYEELDHHEGNGANFLFASGHADWFPKDQAQKLIAELKAGHNPPTRPGIKLAQR